ALIKIQRGDGVTFSYEVVKVQAYSYQNVDMSALLSPIVPGKPGLNLITCTGDVIKSLDGYNQRLVVFAEQVSP
ncbi:MAG TPA: class F sortase, partial [Candidatus Saccharimonadales bacterium]|nr:class F sortase [Candidatus Saccharimonadales bacterium]